MNKISSLARMGIAHRCFGNPIPMAAYDLIDATEKCVAEFNPKLKIDLPEPYDDGHGNLWLPLNAVISAIKKAGGEIKE